MGGCCSKCSCDDDEDQKQSNKSDSGQQENSCSTNHKDLEGYHLLDSSGNSLQPQNVTQQQNIKMQEQVRQAYDKLQSFKNEEEKQKYEKPYIGPIVANTIEALDGKVTSFRRIKNKGDSFYAAIAFQYLEYLIYKGNDREFERLLGTNMNDEFNTQLKNLRKNKQPIQFEQLFADNWEFYQSGISLIEKLMPKQYGSENKLLEKFGQYHNFTIILFQEGKLNEIQPNILNDKIISLYESGQHHSIAYLSEQKQIQPPKPSDPLNQHQQQQDQTTIVIQPKSTEQEYKNNQQSANVNQGQQIKDLSGVINIQNNDVNNGKNIQKIDNAARSGLVEKPKPALNQNQDVIIQDVNQNKDKVVNESNPNELQRQQPEEPILVVTQDQLIINLNSLIDQINFHGQANQDDNGRFVQVHQMIQQLAPNQELLQKHLAARFIGYYQFEQNAKTYTPLICSYLQQMTQEQFKQFELLVKKTPFWINIKDNEIPTELFDQMANQLLDYSQEFIKNYGYQNGQGQQVIINNRMYNLFVIFFMNLHFNQKEPIVNTNIPDPSPEILKTLANKLNISFLIHQVDNETKGGLLNVIGNLSKPWINLLLYQNNYIQAVPAQFDISLLNHLLDSTCRGRVVPEEFRRFVGVLCYQDELIEEYGEDDEEFNQNIRQKLKGYQRIRGDGNCFYTAFFYQYLHLVIYKFNEAQFQQFIVTILNTPISITLEQFKITDNYAYSYEFAKQLLWIRMNDHQNQDNDNNNLLINTMADPVGIFYGLAILFLRSYTNQLYINDELALALSEDSLTPSLLEWEKECNSIEIMIEMLSRHFQINITVFFIDPMKNMFTDDKRYGDAGHPKVNLILRPGHYQIGIPNQEQ